MEFHQPVRIFVCGTTMAGSRTFLTALGDLVTPRFRPGDSFGPDDGWVAERRTSTGLRRLLIRAKSRTSLSYAIGEDSTNPELIAEAAFLRRADGVVFVIDSQLLRMAANHHAVDSIRQALGRLGRDPSRVPTVFALNKRDLGEIGSVAELSQAFRLGRDAHVPTVAVTGQGVGEAVDALLALREA